jgi:6-phosphogluconolactonase
VTTLPPDFEEFSHTAHLEVSADGRYVYASNRGHDSIMVADLDDERTGEGPAVVPQRRTVAVVLLSHPGPRMLVANQQSDNVAVIEVAAAGDLHLLRRVDVPHPVFLAPLPKAVD